MRGSVLVLAASSAALAAPALASQSAVPLSGAAKRPALVGRWSHLRTCEQLVAALGKAGLGTTAPVAVGDFFPNQTPAQLAAKPDVCSGATPQLHSHFFTAAGKFGSLDQHN